MTEQIKQRQPLIELKDVTKTYHDGKRKDVFAVSNFNLTLYEGETLGLVGESAVENQLSEICLFIFLHQTKVQFYFVDKTLLQ